MKKFFSFFALIMALATVSNFANAVAGTWVMHDAFKLRGYNGSNLDITATGNTIKIALFASTSNAATTSVNNYASLTDELSTANGYTAGGYTVTHTWTGTSTVTFTFGSAEWTASGGSITARFAVAYNDTDTNKTVIAHVLLNNTPADETVTSGNTLTVTGGTLMTLARNDADWYGIAMAQAEAANDPFWMQRVIMQVSA